MRKRIFLIILSSLLLTGCWDERLFKEVANVGLIGVEGEPGQVTVFFNFPSVMEGSVNFFTINGEGLSLREARMDANEKSNEQIDVSQLEVILVNEETAKHNLYNYFDVIYRDPHNRLAGRMGIVEGEVKQYIEKTEEMPADTIDYFGKLFQTAVNFAVIPDYDLQQTATMLFDKSIDLVLPYIVMNEQSNTPEITGLAIFNENVFTGHILDWKKSKILQVMRNSKSSKTINFSYEWKNGDMSYPLSLEVVKSKKEWNITNDKITATYDIEVNVEEFPHNHLDKKKMRAELNKFLSKEMTKEFNEVIKKLQEAKSDPIGFGRQVRAFHQDLWHQGDWHDTFAEMDVEAKVKVKIVRSGVLN